ncbi:cobalamin-dependent protein, partial [Klebsiella pneumoniae]
MKRTVYLVNACNDDSISSIANDYSFAALNVLALGTWLEKHLPEIQVVCRDAGIQGCDTILNEIDEIKPWFVGISVLVTSYGSALKIAEQAKKNNAIVTFGNDHAAQLCREILKCRNTVDYILGAEYGEYPLELLIRKLAYDQGELSEIPSLTYRNINGDICGFDFNKNKESLSILNYPII